MLRKNIFFVPLLIMLTALPGCKQGQDVEIPFIPGFGPRKIDIHQGNIVTQEMVDKLQAGMTRNQVRFVLGTPLLVDLFRSDRWDYIYLLQQGGSRVEQRQLKVYFKDDRLVRYEGDLPVDKALANAAGKPLPGTAAPQIVGPPGQPPLEKPAMGPAASPAAPATPAPPPQIGDPQLRLSPAAGQPASTEERAAASTPAPAPAAATAVPQPLEAPPLPRIQLPPEEPQTPVPGEKPAATKP